MITKYSDRTRWILRLAAVYIAGVAVRYAIALIAGRNPFVMPDEALYANIARSIAQGAVITLRNQPVTYTNVLYPLLISPIYALFPAGTQFRAIQFFNCVVMNLAVFPAYGIAKRFTDNRKAFLIAAFSLLLPDMLLTTRIMTEAIEYPLFLAAVYLMFTKLSGGKEGLGRAALTGFVLFLLTQAKSGMIAPGVVFLGILIYDAIRRRRSADAAYALVFAGTFTALALALHFALQWAGMDFTQRTIYETQTQAPTLDHIKKTLPGLLLYAFFIPVAFGIYPLLMPASNIKLYDDAEKKQLRLVLISLALCAAGACYMFFDTETIGNYFAGRIHIRYVFMFLPVLVSFAASPKIEGARPNGKLLAALGFLLAMAVTVRFDALLSGRLYPADAISLSYIIYDDNVLNWRLLSQIAAITFAAGMLIMLRRRGWDKLTKRVCAVVLTLGLLTAGGLGYDLSNYNNVQALSDDAKQAAQTTEGNALIVPDGGIYFDNTLSVLDISMSKAPYAIMYDDLCASLGAYGRLESVTPPKYWTEKPSNAAQNVKKVVFNAGAFYRMVPAADAQVQYTDNGYYGIVTPGGSGRLFHSALAGLTQDGVPGQGAALYIYNEQLLLMGAVRVYLEVSCKDGARLSMSAGDESYNFDITPQSDWIYADFTVPQGCTALKVSLNVASGLLAVKTYSVE